MCSRLLTHVPRIYVHARTRIRRKLSVELVDDEADEADGASIEEEEAEADQPSD